MACIHKLHKPFAPLLCVSPDMAVPSIGLLSPACSYDPALRGEWVPPQGYDARSA